MQVTFNYTKNMRPMFLNEAFDISEFVGFNCIMVKKLLSAVPKTESVPNPPSVPIDGMDGGVVARGGAGPGDGHGRRNKHILIFVIRARLWWEYI